MSFWNKNIWYLTLAGFIWGLSGFTVEMIPESAILQQLILRFVFIVVSTAIIYIFFPVRFKNSYLLTILLLLFYLLIMVLTSINNNASPTNIIRELILFYSCFSIIVVLSAHDYLHYFLKGVYFSLILIIIFYFSKIEFSQFFSLLYRLRSGLNPNSIGTMAVMLFIISLYRFNENIMKKERFISFILILISTTVLIATRSRTAIVMMFIAYITIHLFFNNKKTLAISFILAGIVIIINLEAFQNIIRLTTPADYSGKKNITNLTGRLDIWKYGLQIIYDHFLIGVGPDKAIVKVGSHMGSFHNAYIQLMVTAGALGFTPILLILLNAIKRVLSFKEDLLISIIFISGLFGTLVENRLLNFGSPGNLLFLIALLYLSRTNEKNPEGANHSL